MKYYVGINGTKYEAFRSAETPTPASGYQAVIGPFRTKRGAAFMAEYGLNNPHLPDVATAERIAKRQAA